MMSGHGLRFGYFVITCLFSLLRPPCRGEMWKDAEILLLRHQLAVLQRQQGRRPKLSWGGPGVDRHAGRFDPAGDPAG
jgi:hypothetical protein